MTGLCSVVIPTHNRRNRLLRTLATVLAQSYREFEVVVSVDGSTDGTAEAVAAIDDERIYVGSSDGNLYVLDRADGSTIAQLPTGEMVWTSPALVDGFLYFGAHDGQIHAYRVQ